MNSATATAPATTTASPSFVPCCSRCHGPFPTRADNLPGPDGLPTLERYWGVAWDIADWICRSCRDELIDLARRRGCPGKEFQPSSGRPPRKPQSQPKTVAHAAEPTPSVRSRLRVGEEPPIHPTEKEAIRVRAVKMKMDHISEAWLPIIQLNWNAKCPACTLRDETYAEMIGRGMEE